MSSQMVQSSSPADLWHRRLNQAAHRLSCLGWLMLPAVFLPAKVDVSIAAAMVMCAAIVAAACAFCSSLLVRPDNRDRREAVGALAFSLLLLAAIAIIARSQHIQIKAHLTAWLSLAADPQWLRWCLRGAMIMLVAWIAIVTALGRRGRA